MATPEKYYRQPGACCGHRFAKHEDKDKSTRCLAEGCGCPRWRAQPGDRLRWRARWRDPKDVQRAKTFDRRVDAERHLINVQDSMHRGAYVDPKDGRILLRDWAERWYRSTAHLQPSTRHDYRALLDNHVLPTFGDVHLADIDALDVREWVAELVAGHTKPCRRCGHSYPSHRRSVACAAEPDCDCPGWQGGISPKRARKAHQVLCQLLGRAVEGRRLVSNQGTAIPRKDLPKVQKREMGFLGAWQIEILATAIDPRFSTLVRFAAYTGLRPCEAVALRRKRLDLLRGTVRVAEAAVEVGGRLEWGAVKTHEARTVRVPRSLIDDLAKHLDGRPDDPEALVFTAPLGGPIHENGFMGRYFKPGIAAANEMIAKLPKDQRPDPIPADLRFYDLRHTCASLLIREGASIKAVQRQMGHATAAMTLDTYGHLFPDELDHVAERLDRVRAEALAAQDAAAMCTACGPEVVPIRKAAGQGR